jgi:GMP synthase-like glutamine amidotransferase
MIALAPSHKAQMENYTSWLEKRGFSYRILREGDTLEGCSLLMLCGGPDVGSAGKRDQLEMRWFNLAKDKMPIVGICRGLQLSNVIMGGTLYEDLSDEPVKHTTNRIEIAGEPSPLLESSWHDVVFEDGKKIRVNSRHHQGIKELAPGLKPLAVCTEDGLVEIAEGENCLFVQWHPERPDVWGTEAESIVYEWLKKRYIESSPVEKIRSYAKSKGFTVVSNDRIRKNIGTEFSENFLTQLVKENSSSLKFVTDKQGRKAIKILN